MEHTDLDRSFMEMASVASESSLCKRRQVGVIIRPNEGIKTFGGFNDTILYGKKHCIRYEYKEGERLDLCPAIHAEVMAIAIAARGGGSIEGATMYTTSCIPCKMCMQAIVLAGIKRIVVAEDKDYAGDTSARRLAEIYGIQIDVLDMKEDSDDSAMEDVT